MPILVLFLTSPTLPLSDLDEYAETIVAQRISMVAGVSEVQVFGQAKYAVRVQVDPNELAARQIGLNEIDAALRNWNVNLPTGTLYGPHTLLQHSGQRPVDAGRRIPPHHRGLPERRSGPPQRRGPRDRQHAGRQELRRDLTAASSGRRACAASTSR